MSILQPHDLESEQFEPAFHFLPLSHSQIKRDMETQATQNHPMERFAI